MRGYLNYLEDESIYILREAFACSKNPVVLFSSGKDSCVLLKLAEKAFSPHAIPFTYLNIDTGWKFKEMYRFRDYLQKKYSLNLINYINDEAVRNGVNPFTNGSAYHTEQYKTQGLKQAIDMNRFDFIVGGARRDEEKSRSKERIFSHRNAFHQWTPELQRPEPWRLYNTLLHRGETMRVFPLSNWTELDVWNYIKVEKIEVPSLYFAATRSVVERDGMLIMLDDDRFPLRENEVPKNLKVRFRTLGCYPLSGAIVSSAETIDDIVSEIAVSKTTERVGRAIDKDSIASMEIKKRNGYF